MRMVQYGERTRLPKVEQSCAYALDDCFDGFTVTTIVQIRDLPHQKGSTIVLMVVECGNYR